MVIISSGLRLHLSLGLLGLVILGFGVFEINKNLAEKNELLKQQLILQEKSLDSQEAGRAQKSIDVQKQIDADRYNQIRAECVAEEKKTAQDLEDFLGTCILGTDACLASEGGKLLTSGLGEQSIRKCISMTL